MRSFFEISEKMDVLLAEKKCQEVLNLLDTIQEYLSEEEFNQSEFARKVYQANAKIMLGKLEDVIMLLKKGNVSGFSFPLHWKFFAELENNPEFANIKQANEEVIQKAKKNTKYEYEVMLPEGYDGKQKYPLFFCLHGDGFCCNKKEQMHYWKTDAIRNKGAIVVYPQSSQVYFSDSYGWLIDPQKAREDMADLYQEMKTKYSIDEEKVVVAGFSGGATAVVDLAVHNVFPIKGVIALCAGDYLEEETLKDTLEMAKRGTKLAFYEASEAKEPTLAPFLQRLRETGNHYEYHLMEGIGHWYPADIEEKSLKALDYFKSREVMNILIRLENETDYQRVEEITKLAFSYPGRVERGQIGCPYEHWMVHELRKRDGIQQLSLVAEVGNVVVGHIICSEAIVRTADQITSVLNFGPISVLPEYQHQGVGSALINAMIDKAKSLGYGAILFFGRPEYYPQFGFKEASTFGITDSEGYNYPAFMGMELIPKYLSKALGGKYFESDIYNDDLNREKVRVFDDSFHFHYF